MTVLPETRTDSGRVRGVLGFAPLLGVGSMIVTVRRLRVPYKKLGVGTRVA